MHSDMDPHRRQRRANIIIMSAIIVLAIAGIILRWDHVRNEAGAAVKSRFDRSGHYFGI
jgi:flagellar basal body-associated protein FliL